MGTEKKQQIAYVIFKKPLPRSGQEGSLGKQGFVRSGLCPVAVKGKQGWMVVDKEAESWVSLSPVCEVALGTSSR